MLQELAVVVVHFPFSIIKIVMTKKIAFQMDHISSIDVKMDSTYMLMLEAQRRGFLLYHYTPKDLFLENGIVKAIVSQVELFAGQEKFFKLSNTKIISLSILDMIFIRQDPPFNMHYITTTYLLEKIQHEVLFINHPTAIRNAPEKLLVCDFKEYMPETLVSENIEIIEHFIKDFEQIIVKPLYACGGKGVSKHVKPFNNLTKSLTEIQQEYQTPAMIQRYLPEIKVGDIRVVLAGGKIMGQVLKVPKEDSVIANFHAGGTPHAVDLNQKQIAIINKLSPILKQRKLHFVGLDFIGNYLTEINVTSPSGIPEMNLFLDNDVSKKIWDEFLTIPINP